jgi:hypothetical protein
MATWADRFVFIAGFVTAGLTSRSTDWGTGGGSGGGGGRGGGGGEICMGTGVPPPPPQALSITQADISVTTVLNFMAQLRT